MRNAWLSRLALSVVPLWLLACGAQLVQSKLDQEYGEAAPTNREIASPIESGIDFHRDVKPIIDRRCVSCHGCYDAPCQLKLTAIEGIERGASKARVYDPSRVVQAAPTRLFEDAFGVEAWREMEFFPILNERENIAEANVEASVLARMLRLKRKHPLPKQRRLVGFDFALDRKQSCPTIEEFPKYEREHATGGMPYGLPGLTTEESSMIEKWIAQGAVHAMRPALSEELVDEIGSWERLLNGDELKSQLIARYLYEHLFLAHLYFEDLDEDSPTYFELVRSKTPPGRAVERIATRRPHDAPGVERVYYRFVPVLSTLVEKTHMPYALSAARRQKWEGWFFAAPFEVDHLPPYDEKSAANPFATFLQIPVGPRYRFLLDEARFTLDGFIKGPVCRGQTSLNVINDRFWVFFLDPNNVDQAEAQFYASQIEHLSLPPNDQTGALVLARWLEYAKKEKTYLDAKSKFLVKQYGKQKPVDLNLIWTGNGSNRNATLTVFRHDDSASVVQGLVGAPPKTSWLLGYGILERIHYLLVTDFDVFGNLSHQLVTRIYMDFLRMEAEANLVSFLPKWSREPIVASWYEGAEKEALPFILGRHKDHAPDTALSFASRNPELELYEVLGDLLEPVQSHEYEIAAKDADLTTMARALERIEGGAVTLLSPVSLIRLEGEEGQSSYLTLLRDNDHKNILSIFGEESRRRPERDRLTVVQGLIGAYPNALFRVKREELDGFVGQLSQLDSEGGYDALRDDFGVRRSDPDFWSFSDLIHRELRDQGHLVGWLDYNRLDNR